MGKPKVAVIGAGVLGLTALKNLREEGFDAVAFDRHDYVGGLWRFTDDENTTSVTEGTQWNSCSQMSCYTDFPFPPGTPDYPSMAQIQSYLAAYCEHFKLNPHIKLQHQVKKVSRNDDNTMWKIEYIDKAGNDQEETFDKVMMALGQTGKRHMPIGISGLENFKGTILHGQAFKRGSDFANKRVLVLGSSNTAMDCVVDMCGHAEKIYLSHRHGGVIIPRLFKHVPVEYNATIRLQALARIIGNIAPSRWATIFNGKCLEISEKTFGTLPKEWRFNNPPKGQMWNPIINDKIVDLLREEKASVVQSVRRVLDNGNIELADGSVISDVDTILLCTGYEYDFSILGEDVNPIKNQSKDWEDSKVASGKPFPRLYRGIFSLDHPDSLAYLGLAGYVSSQMPLHDLMSMAIAQVWKGEYGLPSRAEMEAEVDSRRKWIIETSSKDSPSPYPAKVQVGPWTQWLHDAAGTGVNENLGYGLHGWLYWIKNPRESWSVMNGVNSPHLWRLFEGRRKKWEAAKEAIAEVNKDVKKRKAAGSSS